MHWHMLPSRHQDGRIAMKDEADRGERPTWGFFGHLAMQSYAATQLRLSFAYGLTFGSTRKPTGKTCRLGDSPPTLEVPRGQWTTWNYMDYVGLSKYFTRNMF